jgi:hypothetical protein
MMATPAALAQQIDGEIEAIWDMVSEMAEIVDDWWNLPESVRVSWSLDWDQAMGTLLPHVESARQAGQLNAVQETRYHSLLDTLEQLTPTIIRLNLFRPLVSLNH